MGNESRVITRVRPSLTCLPCKRRKVKCDKRRPCCRQCERLSDTCVYENPRCQAHAENQAQKKQRREPEQAHDTRDVQGESPHISAHMQNGAHSTTPESRHMTPVHFSDMMADQADAMRCGTPEAEHAATNLVDAPRPSFFQNQEDVFLSASNNLEDFFVSSHSAYPSVPFQSDNPLVQALPEAMMPQQDWMPTFEYPPNVPDTLSVVDKWASREDLDGTRMSIAPQKLIHEQEILAKSPSCQRTPFESSPSHVGSPFWVFASNREFDCDLLLQAHRSRHQSTKIDQHRWSDLCKVLGSLPSKRICDVLLSSFLLSVRPLVPLVHGPTLQADYEGFWVCYGNSRTTAAPDELIDHVDFFPLLWAVLFCGAVAASPSFLAEASFQVRDATTFLSRLRSKLDETLSLCRHDEIPTLSGLIASLLVHECDPNVDEILTGPPFVCKCMQAARTLGLHKEESVAARGKVEGEIARRVWYHVVQVEVIATVASGGSLSYNSREESYSTRMPSELNDASMCLNTSSLESFSTHGSKSNASSAMLLAIGRYELSCTLRRVVEKCYGNQTPSEEGLATLIAVIEKFESKLEGLIQRLEVRGLPEQGHVSTKLLSADPFVHKHLYRDNPGEETVFNALARIMLGMMKGYVSILFNRQFLGRVKNEQTSKIWNSEISICSKFLRNYLHLARLPAFSPYYWFCPGKIQPLQECMIVLTYLKEHPHDGDTQMLVYLLSEVFDLFDSYDASSDRQPIHGLNRRCEAAWQVLHGFREEVIQGRNKLTRSRNDKRLDSTTASARTYSYTPSSSVRGTTPESGAYGPGSAHRHYSPKLSELLTTSTPSHGLTSSHPSGSAQLNRRRYKGHQESIVAHECPSGRVRAVSKQSCSCSGSRETPRRATVAEASFYPSANARNNWDALPPTPSTSDMPDAWLDVLGDI